LYWPYYHNNFVTHIIIYVAKIKGENMRKKKDYQKLLNLVGSLQKQKILLRKL